MSPWRKYCTRDCFFLFPFLFPISISVSVSSFRFQFLFHFHFLLFHLPFGTTSFKKGEVAYFYGWAYFQGLQYTQSWMGSNWPQMCRVYFTLCPLLQTWGLKHQIKLNQANQGAKSLCMTKEAYTQSCMCNAVTLVRGLPRLTQIFLVWTDHLP